MTTATHDPATIREAARSILEALGARREQAVVQAQHLVEGDLRGHPSHGVQRLRTLVRRIRNGVLIPDADIEIDRRTSAFASVNGGGGLGPWVAKQVLDDLETQARQVGVAIAAVSSSGHLGILLPYVERCAKLGLIGVVATTSEALVHPWGGSQALLGTNPLAIGVPASGTPLLVDIATGIVPMGRVIHHQATGEPLQPGWAVDAQGMPTTDPTAARFGAIAPFGGGKGYALGLALEVLVAGLTASAFGADVTGTLDTTEPVTKGDLFLVIDPSVCGVGDLSARVAAYLAEVRQSRPAEPEHPVRIPGDGSRTRRRAALEAGLTLTDEAVAFIESTYRDLIGRVPWKSR